MKKMMMALAALCVAGAASAVTAGWTDWQDVSVTAVQNGSGVNMAYEANGFHIDKEVGFALQVTMVIGTDAARDWINGSSPSLIGIGQGYSSDRLSVYRMPGKTQFYSSTVGASFGKEGQTFDFVTGANTLLFEYNAETKTFSMSHNGVHVVSISPADTAWQGFEQDIDMLTIGAMKNGSTWEENMSGILGGAGEWSVSDVQYSVTPVPEPTALALLALGVAGLALRRKAA